MARFKAVGRAGDTVTFTITRDSDGWYFTGSGWQAGATSLAGTWDADHELFYVDTVPDAICSWSAEDQDGRKIGYGEFDPSTDVVEIDVRVT